MCRESPYLDLGAIELEIPTLHGLTHAFKAVFDLLYQLLEHRLDGVIAARRPDRRAPGVKHLGARLEREARGNVHRSAPQGLTQFPEELNLGRVAFVCLRILEQRVPCLGFGWRHRCRQPIRTLLVGVLPSSDQRRPMRGFFGVQVEPDETF